MSFWGRHDCDAICGIIDSMSHIMHPVVTCHTAGWFYENGRKGYFYGYGVPENYEGEIPEGFEVREIPASYGMRTSVLIISDIIPRCWDTRS